MHTLAYERRASAAGVDVAGAAGALHHAAPKLVRASARQAQPNANSPSKGTDATVASTTSQRHRSVDSLVALKHSTNGLKQTDQ